jgi:hypothetical protein
MHSSHKSYIRPYLAFSSACARAKRFKPVFDCSDCTARVADITKDVGNNAKTTHRSSSSNGKISNGRGRGRAWDKGLIASGSIEKGSVGSAALDLERRLIVLLSLPPSASSGIDFVDDEGACIFDFNNSLAYNGCNLPAAALPRYAAGGPWLTLEACAAG